MIIDYLSTSRRPSSPLVRIGVLLAVTACALQFASLPLLDRHIGPDWLEIGFPVLLALVAVVLLLKARRKDGAAGWNTWGKAGFVLGCVVCVLPLVAFCVFMILLYSLAFAPGKYAP